MNCDHEDDGKDHGVFANAVRTRSALAVTAIQVWATEFGTAPVDGATVLRIPLARGRHMALELPPDLTKTDMLLARKLIGAYLHHLPLPIKP